MWAQCLGKVSVYTDGSQLADCCKVWRPVTMAQRRCGVFVQLQRVDDTNWVCKISTPAATACDVY